MFDLAYESGADYIVTIDRDIHDAASELGFNTIYPEDFLEMLRRQYER